VDVQQLLQLVGAKREQSGDSDDRSVLQVACWFVAVQEAQQVLGSFSVKDLAYTIADGLPLGGPYRTEQDLQIWIDATEDGYDDDEDWGWLDAELNTFFGITH
jgi:hypothetical protein